MANFSSNSQIHWYSLILFLLFSVSGFSQVEVTTTKSKKAIKLFQEALKFYESKNDKPAVESLKKAVEIDDKFLEGYLLLGNIYYDNLMYEDAVVCFQRVVNINEKFNPNAFYYLASSQYKSEKYAESVVNVQKFLDSSPRIKSLKEKGEELQKHAQFAKEAFENPVKFNPKNMGEMINSAGYEYFPTFTTDEQTMVFTRLVDAKAAAHMTSSDQDEDFFISKIKDGKWLPAINFKEINSPFREGAQCVSPDGLSIYFTGCNRPDGKGKCDIYVTRRVGDKWLPAQNLGVPVNSTAWESQPALSSDGKTLYFASDRNGGKGGIDIWKTTMQHDGNWSIPINVEELNTKHKDESPFIHPDGTTIYFSSEGHPGMGERDLFLARLKPDGKFDTPQNLGYPINTSKDENTLFVTASGKRAFFASEKEGGYGKLDIYEFELPVEARPNVVNYTMGIVYNAKTKQRLKAKFE